MRPWFAAPEPNHFEGNVAANIAGGRHAPDLMSGDDGECIFVRRDLAETVVQAKEYALKHDGANVSGYEVDEVLMLEVPDHFTGIDYDWATVREGTPGAVAYWRFRV